MLSEPDLALYLAGSDPYTTDRFGRLNVTKQGLAKRDRLVFHQCLQKKIPVALTMAGGYAQKVEDTVDIHFETIKTALTYHKEWNQSKNNTIAEG